MRAEEVNKAGSGQGGGVSRWGSGVARRKAVAVGETVRVFRRGLRVRGGKGAEAREQRGSGSGKGRSVLTRARGRMRGR